MKDWPLLNSKTYFLSAILSLEIIYKLFYSNKTLITFSILKLDSLVDYKIILNIYFLLIKYYTNSYFNKQTHFDTYTINKTQSHYESNVYYNAYTILPRYTYIILNTINPMPITDCHLCKTLNETCNLLQLCIYHKIP